MELVVKVLLHCLHSLIGWCVDLNDCVSVLDWHLNLAEIVCSYIGSHSFKLFLTSFDMILLTPNLFMGCIITCQTRIEFCFSSYEMDLPI